MPHTKSLMDKERTKVFDAMIAKGFRGLEDKINFIGFDNKLTKEEINEYLRRTEDCDS